MAQGRKIKAYQVYQIVVDVLAFAVLGLVTFFYPMQRPFDTIFFMALAAVAESQTIWMGTHEAISISSAVTIAAMLVCGPAASVWAAAVSVLGSVSRKSQKEVYHIFNTPLHVTAFNISNYSLTAALTSLLYFHMGGKSMLAAETVQKTVQTLTVSALPLLLSVMIGVIGNALLFGVYQLLYRNVDSLRQILHYLVLPTLNLFCICMMGVFLAVVYVEYHWFMVALLFLPFMLARYVFTTYKQLQQSYLQTVESLAAAIETKDEYTSGHSQRVEKYSLLIAREMKLSSHRCENLRYAALLHDIGKIGIPETVLNKPGRLTEEEMDMIRQHPGKGAHIVEDIEFLSEAVEIIRSHHERYAGGGYPTGKPARDMSQEAMILCVADAFDAMTSDRSYRSAMSREKALEELKKGSGTQFCPEVVDAMDKVLKHHPDKGREMEIHI